MTVPKPTSKPAAISSQGERGAGTGMFSHAAKIAPPAINPLKKNQRQAPSWVPA
jgi:hypothetical protein